MDYEKKYKELVAKIKNAHLYAQTDSTKNVLEGILPELADAFIEKACNFIDERLNFDDNAWYIEGEVTVKDKVIEDFKNYMKG